MCYVDYTDLELTDICLLFFSPEFWTKGMCHNAGLFMVFVLCCFRLVGLENNILLNAFNLLKYKFKILNNVSLWFQ